MGSSSEEMERLTDSREGLDAEAAPLAIPPPLPPKRAMPASSTGKATSAAPVAFRPAMSLPAVPVTPQAGSSSEPSEAALRKELAEARRQGTEALARAAAAEAKAAELRAELRTVEEDRKDLSRSLAEVEAELGRARAQVEEQRAELRAEAEDRKDLSRALAEVEAELGRLTEELRQEREARGSLAEELVGAKEALVLAQERVGALEAELRTVEEDRKDLSRALAEVEAELGRVRAQVAEAGASHELVLERDQLKEDVAAMKRKLMAAEIALETAASYKMKLTKLEAQLAQLRGAK